MKPKTVMLLAVAVGCGLVAMLGVQQAINAKPKATEVETTRVLVALENIDPGFPLTPEMVEFRELPKAGLPADAVTTEAQYEERSLNFPVAADDVIRTSKLSEPGVSGRSLTIPPGFRVVGISVDDTQTQTGMLKPGDLVDVYVTYETRAESRGQAMTQVKTLLEAITVFATDNQTANQATAAQESKTKVVSLLVDPEQASYLTLAQRKGKLTLVWRNPTDDEILEIGGVNEALLEELRGTVGTSSDLSYFDFNDPELRGLPQVTQDEGALVEEPQAIVEEQPEPTVTEFLDNQENAGMVATTTPVAVEPAAPAPPPPPMWTITIYSGAGRTQTAFEIPGEGGKQDSATTTDDALHAGQAPPSEEVMTSLSEEDLDAQPLDASSEESEQELDANTIQEVLQGLLPTL